MIDELRVEWRDVDASRTVWVSGEIDLATVDALRTALECPQPRLEVDLSNVTFIDLTGLRSLIDASEAHEEVALIASLRVGRLIELTATSHLFTLL